MKNPLLRCGCFVRIKGNKDEPLAMEECIGQITETQGHGESTSIFVEFDNRHRHKSSVDFQPDEKIILEFAEKDLEFVPNRPANEIVLDHWPPQGGMGVNVSYTMKHPIDGTKPCAHENCTGKQTHSMFVNDHGTVCQYYVCESHHHAFDGKNIEGFPLHKELRRA